MGNAFGALGADPAAAAINPAGFALYRSSSLSLSLSLDVVTDKAAYYGLRQNATEGRVALPNLAFVMHAPGKEGGLRSAAYGLVHDRAEVHRSRTSAFGDRVPSTVLQRFVEEAEGTPFGSIGSAFPFTAGLAWETFGIDTLPGFTDRYFPYIPYGSPTNQRHTIEAAGSTSRTSFFYAANLDDRIHLGAQASIVGHRFNRTTTHAEYSLDPTLALGQLEFQEKLVTTGSGLELAVGAVVRPHDRWRVGASFFGPAWMSMSDAYVTRMRTGFRDEGGQDDFDLDVYSPDGSFAYRITTPWRATASAAYIAGGNGLVSIDYEYADLPGTRFGRSRRIDDSYDFAAENAAIGRRFRGQHAVRAGTEWRFGNWYARGGWGFVQDGWRKGDLLAGRSRRTYALGGGHRGEHITIDLALAWGVRGLRNYAYDPALVEPMEIDRSTVTTLLTVAFRP